MVTEGNLLRHLQQGRRAARQDLTPDQVVWLFIVSNSSSVSLAGFCKIKSEIPILPTSCSRAATRNSATSSAGS